MISGIYKITSPSGKIYIGQSWDLVRRERQYRTAQCKCQTHLYNSIKKYGWGNHKFEILMNVSERIPQLLFTQIEQKYMDYYRISGAKLMNLKGAGTTGKLSQETKDKISAAHKGKKPGPMPVEIREKIRNANKGRALGSAEGRERTRQKLTGRKLSPEHRLKCSLVNIGRKQSEETKIKRSQTLLKIGTTNKTVYQYDLNGNFIKEWRSMTEAGNALGIDFRGISRCASGERPTYKKFVWMLTKTNC